MLTIELCAAADDGTLLLLTHEKLDALAQAMPEVVHMVAAGWDNVLDKLSALQATQGA